MEFIGDSSIRIKDKDLEYLNIQMVIALKGITDLIRKMGKESMFGLMGSIMRDTIRMIGNMERENMCIKMGALMKEGGRTIGSMGMVCRLGPRAKGMKGTGSRANIQAMESCIFPEEVNIRVIGAILKRADSG